MLFCGMTIVFAANDDYSTWGNWRYVYLVTDATGAKVNATISNFPVLIRLNPGNFDDLANTADNGSDVRFSLSDGTHLAYAIERWKHTSSSIDTAEIWVLVPSIAANDTTVLKMYWNKSGAGDSTRKTTVFDTSNAFKGVWHLGENPANGAGSIKDWTVLGSNGTPYGTMTAADSVKGIIGTALDFDGTDDYVSFGDIGAIDGLTKFTASIWIKIATLKDWTGIFSKAGDNVNQWSILENGVNNQDNNDFLCATRNNGDGNTQDGSTTGNILSTGNWYYCVLVFDGTQSTNATRQKFYFNGAAQTLTFRGTIPASLPSTSWPVQIAKTAFEANYFVGTMDEAVVARTARDANWIKLCYQNQRQTNNRDSLVWFSSSYSSSTIYVWDNSTSSGYQAASGTWGTNNYWTPSGAGGTVLYAWPGAGNSAIFDGSDGTYTITINGTQNVDSIAFLNSGNTLSGGTAINFGTQNSILVASGKTAAISTVITGSGGLTKYDAGTLTLSGNNTYTGTITVNAGTLRLTGTPTSNALKYVINNGTISVADRLNLSPLPASYTADWVTINGGTFSTAIASGNGYSTNRGFTIGASGGTIDIPNTDNSNVVPIQSVIAGTGALTKTGVGTLNLSGVNTYSGNTTVSAGTLQLGAANVIPDGSGKGDVSLTGTLDLNTYSEGINGLSGAGTVTSGASGAVTLTIGNNDATSTFSGVIQNGSGTVSITKAGNGTLTLSGANTYTGTTTVSAGTLLITNTTGSGAVSVSDGATLGGTGKIGTKASTVSVDDGGTLDPGVSGPGKLTINNNLTLSSGATFSVDINSATPATGYDQVFDTGTVTLGGAALSLTLGYAPTAGQTYTIIDNDGAEAPGAFNGISQGGTVTATYNSIVYSFTVSYTGGTGNDVVLTCASSGGTKTWDNGGSDNKWSTAANWNPDGVPTSADSVVFNSSQTANCNLDAAGTVKAISFTSGYTGTFNFSGNALTITGPFGDFRSGGTITAGGGSIEFSGATGSAQVFTPKSSSTFPAITQTGTDTLRLSTNALTCASFSQSAGKLNFNGLNVTTTGDFTVTNGASTSLVNIGGRKITVGGNASLSGAQANALSISPATPCSLAVTGTLTAYGATLGNCKAPDGSSAGTATNSTDAGGNYRWTFSTISEDYTQWHYSKKVFINTKEGGANIKSDQSNFPLLVRLTSANFNFRQARSAGQDVRFSKSNGVHFNYQIERWDQTNSAAEVWVKIDAISGYNDAQYFWMYWGKSDAVDSSSSALTFETTNSFAGVWHLKEDPSGSGAVMLDATSNGNHGTSTGTMTSGDLVDAVVGKGVDFDGSNDGITVADANSLDLTTGVTVSGWFKASALTSYAKIADKAYTSNGTPYTIYCLGFDNANHIRGEMDVGGNPYTVAGTTTLNTTDYFYATFTFDNSTMKLFLNGVQEGNTTSHAGPIATDNVAFSIGMAAYPTYTNFFTGTIDEVEVSNIARSADWIKLCYETQRADQTTVIVEENYSDWTYSKNLYLNTKASGANVTSNVVKFPVLVRLDSTVFDFTLARESGQDIRFAKSDGTHLYYQIEQWDNANKAASVWVRVDTVYGSDSAHYIKMYWGNAAVNSMSNARAVFDTGNGFIGVWHLTNNDLTDASCNHNDATNYGTTDTAAVIGTGRKFVDDATPDSMRVAGLVGNSSLQLTLSCWAKVDSIDGTNLKSDLVSIGDNCAMRVVRATDGSRDSTRCNYHYSTSGWNSTVQPGGASQVLHAGWEYLAWMVNPTATGGPSEVTYINGTSVASTTANYPITYSSGGTNTLFGKNGNATSFFFGGVLDEIRIDKTARDQYWVKLCYENQKPGQSLVVFTTEDYSQWTYSHKINLNTTQSGANVATTQYNFPALLRLTSTNFPFSQAQDDGRDIRFAGSLGKQLPYQIERWDRGDQLAEVWVLLDTIKGNNGTQYMTMYWGKAGVASRSDGTAVFDTGNGFAGVWHLNEEGNATALDATVNGNNGTANGFSTSSDTAGDIGIARKFNGTADYLELNNNLLKDLLASGDKKATIGFWFKANSTTATKHIIWEGINTANGWGNEQEIHVSFGRNPAGTAEDNYLSLYLGDATNNPTAGNMVQASTAFSDVTNWNYAAVTVDNTSGAQSATLYLNGVSMITDGGALTSNLSDFNTNTRFGRPGTAERYFDGKLDEVSISKNNRSANWIKLCYENQKADQTLVDFDDYSQWANSKQLYINTTSMSLTGNVIKFPLLVRADTTVLDFHMAQPNGEDVRFSKSDGTHLRYQIEKWDTTNRAGVAWVLVDTIKQSSSAQYIKMYWGKSDAADRSNDSCVFDTANNFAGVWHLNEDGNTTSNGYNDATVNRNGGTGISMTSSSDVAGAIGIGSNFNGTTQYIKVPTSASLRPANITVSAWVQSTTATWNAGSWIASMRNGTSGYGYILSPSSTGDRSIRGYVGVGGTFYYTAYTPASITGWHHYVFTYNAANIIEYIDGVSVATTAQTGNITYPGTQYSLFIGADSIANPINRFGNGKIDELEISNTARSYDWIKLCYYTQVAAQTAVTPDSSAEEFLPLAVSTYGASPADSLDSCVIATHKWKIKLDRKVGGGISWLSPDSLGAIANQLDSNLFYIVTNGNRSDTGLGNLKLLDSGKVFTRLLQRKTIGGQPYGITYTVLGSGRAYIRVETYAASALTPTAGLEFRIANNATSNITNYASSATASSCAYLLHCDAGAGRIDPCLTLFENWTQANSITGTASSKYTGIKSSTWSLPDHRSQAWEFMLDFAHRTWNDSSGVGGRAAVYRHPDSLGFYTGTPYLQKAWESQLSGHWQFEEGGGDTAWDNSGSNNFGVRPSGATWTWTNGKWGGGMGLFGGSDRIRVADKPEFDGASGFAICAWIKPSENMTTSNGIFKKFGTGGYSFTGGSGGVVQLALNATSLPGRTGVGSGTWCHVAALLRRGYSPYDTVKLFINGKPDTIYTGSYSFDTSAADVYIGSGFDGVIDDVRFYAQNMSDDDIKTIYQLGYDAGKGMYRVRADNNNTVHCVMNGATYHRYLPVFQVTNYWSTNQPSASTPKVYMNGSLLAFNKDYFAALDDNRNMLTVGFNSTVNADATRIYISSDDTLSSTTTTTMPKMVWGSYASPSSHFYVKNFTGNTFGSATANQYYADFKMDNTTTGNGGEIFRLKTSKISPCGTADTTSTGNLVSITSATDSASFSCGKYKIGGSWLRSTANVAATPTYTVVESSSVRVILRIDDRKLKKSTDSCNLQTWFSFYPTGQIFRWDSVNIPNATINIDTVRYDVLEIYQASGAGTGVPSSAITNAKLYGGRYGATSIQDYAAAFLALDTLNGATYGMETPSVKDTARVFSIASPPNSGIGTRFVHCSRLLNANKPYQTALYMDVHASTFSSALIDSTAKGVQNCTGASSTTRLIANGAGSTVLNSVGDFNNDGFNEKEGAYIYQADNANTAHFTLTAHGDTCRFYPAFRITNYTATSAPQYVFVGNVAKIKDFGFIAYVKQSSHELLLQLNQTICANTDVYISFDRTLAVTMDDFRADPGDALVKVQWNTQSEENNLGFFLYRRIRPQFLDSVSRRADTIAAAADTEFNPSAGSLMKSKIIGFGDTAWKQVNEKIIYGAVAGVSYGKRRYSLTDRQVYNEVQYEYKLVAVDYNSSRETYDKYASAMPRRVIPLRFALWGNFPNPFRRLTCLKYDLPVRTKVMINIYDIQGRLVRRLVRPDKPVNPGYYQALWDCRDDRGRFLASGPYIYRITAQGFAMARVMVMIR